MQPYPTDLTFNEGVIFTLRYTGKKNNLLCLQGKMRRNENEEEQIIEILCKRIIFSI